MRKTHGESNKSKEWDAWGSMIQRCTNPKNKKYYSHGGRGIKVCDRWRNSFINFLDDMGRAPSKSHSLDRIDNDGNYEPSNCKWATRSEQANNTRSNIRIFFKGKVQTLKQWCDELSLPYVKTKARIKNGWSVERAFSDSDGVHVRKDNVIIEYNGERKHLMQWSRHLGIKYSTLRRRISVYSIDKAFTKGLLT